MNYKMIRYILSVILRTEAALLLLPVAVALIYRENELWPFILSILLTCAASAMLARKKPENSTIFAREGFLVVALAWVLLSVFGMLPFIFSGCIPNPVDAFFETVSGFTTTGATVLTNVEGLPNSILFWREFTHWVGGMGVLVFVMAIVTFSDHSMYLMRAEVPGPSVGKLTPKSRSTAAILYAIYGGLTVLEIIFLLCGGMPLFDSIIHSLGTAGTGGFSIKNASVGAYDSAYIDWVITIFMMLFGVNFNLYYLVLLRQFKNALKSEELRVYFGLYAAAVAMITVNILPLYETVGKSVRYAAFQVASVMTTTGFATADFDLWPNFSRTLLVFMMIIGACAGSTAGGLKVSRAIILIKSLFRSMDQMLHPHKVKSIKFEGRPVDTDTRHGVAIYTSAYMCITLIATLIVAMDGYELETSLTAVVACFNNIGPGIGAVGPMGNYSIFSWVSKLALSLSMLLGRLEIFPMVMLLSPSVWRKNT